MTSKASLLKMALVATGSLIISSCNKLDLIYSWSENYLVYELDHYFDLTNSQEKKIKKEFKAKLNLFLIENDQKIMKYISDYQQMIVIGEFDQLKEFSEMHRSWFNEFAVAMLPLTLEVSSELTEDQVMEFKEKFQKKSEKDSKKDKIKQVQSRLKRWMELIGLEPDAEQTKMGDIFAETKSLPSELQRANTQKNFDRFLAVYKDEVQRKLFLEQLFTKPEFARNAEYSEALKSYIHGQIEVQKAILKTLSEKQKTEIIAHLKKHEKEMRKLLDRVKKRNS